MRGLRDHELADELLGLGWRCYGETGDKDKPLLFSFSVSPFLLLFSFFFSLFCMGVFWALFILGRSNMSRGLNPYRNLDHLIPHVN